MANKDLRIELLQDRENVTIGYQMLWNSEFSTSTGWTTPISPCTGAWDFPTGKIRKNFTGNCARATSNLVLVEGNSYTVKVAIKNYNRLGSILLANHATGNANVDVVTSAIVPAGGAGTGSDYGVYEATWVQGASYTDKIMLYGAPDAKIEIAYLRIYRAAVDKSSVYGVLDATTTEDFPLSLTFAINDPSNIDARKGAYSKTFQIPATANNNKVFKNYNIANSTHHDAPIHDKIECRILVGNLFSLRGLIQLQDVERLNDKPISYSCIFLGDNLAWSTVLETQYLSDLQLENSTNLELSAENIIKTWEADSAVSTTTRAGVNTVNTSPVVYPLVSYGRVNETGWDYGNGFQLYRRKWELDYMAGNTWYNTAQTGLQTNTGLGGNVEPVNDWRPLVWIYNMIHKIFNDVGYKVSSAFMETDNFKKLVYATPNFLFNNASDRKQANTYIGNFRDATCPALSTNLKILYVNSATWTFSVPNQSALYTAENTFQSPYDPLLFRNTCGAGTSTGSGRFQPDVGVITTTAGTQQELLIEQAGGGTPYNRWTIAEAGYYDITTENIMYHFSWDNGDWSGSGMLTSSQTGMTVYANLIVQVRRVGYVAGTWETLGYVDNQSATSLGNFKDNSGAGYHYYGGTLPKHTSTFYFNAGDKIRIIFSVAPIVKILAPQVNYTGSTSVAVETWLYGTNYTDWSAGGSESNGLVSISLANEDIPVYGGVYNLQDVLPNDQKQLDFIKGVGHSFNLQFFTEESSRTVYIEPYTDFYLPPKNAIDWTHKLARNLSDIQQFAGNDFKRRLVFKYQTDDKDWRVSKHRGPLYFNDILDEYPEYRDLGNTYPSGETIFENPFFAGTYDSTMFGAGETIIENTNFYTGALWKASYWYSSTKGYEFKPRMLYYNKMNMPAPHSPLWQGFRAQVGNNASSLFQAKAVQISDVTSQAQTYYTSGVQHLTNSVYNSATFINRYNYTNQFGLSYGNYWAKDYDPSDNSYTIVGNEIGKGLYERYYRTMIDNLIAKPKTRVCYMDLKITDITKLDFRRMIYLDGVYYRLVKIIDYQPHKNTPTKVELHPWTPAVGDSLPTQGVWINNQSGMYPTGVNGGLWPPEPIGETPG